MLVSDDEKLEELIDVSKDMRINFFKDTTPIDGVVTARNILMQEQIHFKDIEKFEAFILSEIPSDIQNYISSIMDILRNINDYRFNDSKKISLLESFSNFLNPIESLQKNLFNSRGHVEKFNERLANAQMEAKRVICIHDIEEYNKGAVVNVPVTYTQTLVGGKTQQVQSVTQKKVHDTIDGYSSCSVQELETLLAERGLTPSYPSGVAVTGKAGDVVWTDYDRQLAEAQENQVF